MKKGRKNKFRDYSVNGKKIHREMTWGLKKRILTPILAKNIQAYFQLFLIYSELNNCLNLMVRWGPVYLSFDLIASNILWKLSNEISICCDINVENYQSLFPFFQIDIGMECIDELVLINN